MRAVFHSPIGFGCLVADRRDQVVERAEGAIAVAPELGVGMAFVVENLELAADGRSRAGLVLRVQVRLDEILDAAVRAGRELEIGHEFKTGEPFRV